MALREITVENLAVVERVRLRLSPGFTALTGETGAGKSLVVDALALALGARASADQVRTGATAASVEAVFDAPAIADDDAVSDMLDGGDGVAIVRREIGADGRSLARVNDRAVTVGALGTLGARLGEIHGQHEQQRLLAPARQLALLDAFGGLESDRAAVADAHAEWRAAQASAAEMLTDPRELARRVELLRHQVGEISAAAPRPGEDAQLEDALRTAAHAEAIARSAAEAVGALREDGGAGDLLASVERALRSAGQHDERFAELAARASGLAAEAAELAREVAATADGIDLDPRERAATEERLALLYDLRSKYGDTLEAVIAFGDGAAQELGRLENQETERERLRAVEEERHRAVGAAAERLTRGRIEAAERLAAAVNEELPPLGLRGGSFGIAIDPADVGPSGADAVTFTFAPNPGEPPRPLSRIASGGEASRLSLAIKVVLAASDETPLLVFDEVDAGVGGRNAAALGDRLKALSAHHQVLCVTHLAQVAARADVHVRVGKHVRDGRTVTEAVELDARGRTTELAAMLAGEDAGSEALAAADALLRGA
jgi:DNA repair protein RecN (Recombination protein N)